MGLIEKSAILKEVSPPLDHFLVTQMLDEFVSMERRFIQRDWEPTELDGGQFAEIVGRIIYHQDSGNLNVNRKFDECLEFVEDDDNKRQHLMLPRQNSLHLAKVLRTIYKFRSQRGAVHISPTYKPNHMDSKFLIEAVRWCLNETLRLFWQGDKELVAKAIREILQFDVPCVGTYEGALLVQRTDLTAEEEILVLLHYAGEAGYNRTELGQHCMKAPATVTTALNTLASPAMRQVVRLASGRFRLTDLGSKRIRDNLAEKLLLQ